jgi:hypothetical protein
VCKARWLGQRGELGLRREKCGTGVWRRNRSAGRKENNVAIISIGDRIHPEQYQLIWSFYNARYSKREFYGDGSQNGLLTRRLRIHSVTGPTKFPAREQWTQGCRHLASRPELQMRLTARFERESTVNGGGKAIWERGEGHQDVDKD